MDTSIFGKALKDVTFADIVSFCDQRITEGLSLDYKRDLSSLSNVVKALVSFANTNGGWLIIGVDDEDDKPKLPVTGMDFEDNHVQKINNSIVSTVSPIVLPFYQVCLSDDGTKAFVVAYMPQSSSTPHWMDYKGKNILFTRVADRSRSEDWEKYASSHEWELLRNRRQASVDLRGELADLLQDIFEARADYQDEEDDKKEEANLQPGLVMAMASPSIYFEGRHFDGTQIITLLPEYPQNPATDTATVQRALLHEPISNGLNDYRNQTPDSRGGVPIYQYGASTHYKDERTNHHYFFGADIYGNLMNVDPIEKHHKSDRGIEHPIVEITNIVTCIDGVLRFAQQYYSKIGIVGNLQLRVEFEGEKNCMLYKTGAYHFPYDAHRLPQNIIGRYLVRRKIDTNILDSMEARNKITLEVMKEILFSFNYAYFKEEDLITLIQQASRFSNSA
ncbi:MAG TPA: ATP-binding protein [Candidatus Limnocylindria bacterium]|nr:ATP-binding protein [Candidatus Limnocylindria bacterium]